MACKYAVRMSCVGYSTEKKRNPMMSMIVWHASFPLLSPFHNTKVNLCTEVGSKDGVPRVTGTRGQCFPPKESWYRSATSTVLLRTFNVRRWKGVECVESASTPKSFLFFEHSAVQPTTRLSTGKVFYVSRQKSTPSTMIVANCQLGPKKIAPDCQILETRLYASAAPSSKAGFQVP